MDRCKTWHPNFTVSRLLLHQRLRQQTLLIFVTFAIGSLQIHGCRGDSGGSLPLPNYPAKILIWPAEFSHWINLKILASNLVTRGHKITVLRSSAYGDFMEETDEFNFINFNVTGIKPGDHLQSMDHVLHLLKLGDGKSSIMQTVTGMVNFWLEQLDMRERQCNAIMTNHEILNRLAVSDYDLVLSDATVVCGEIIAHKLGVPFVYAVRILPAELQFQYSQTPIPISYVPMINTEFTDRMSFLQRTENALNYLYQTIAVHLYTRLFMDPLVQKYLGPETGYKEVMTNASMWLIRTDFAFEYPRPLMPNVKFIGGFHCKPAKRLPDELESFINGSGDDGFIVFSMGSMVRHMHKTKANLIASAFAKLKQRVVWRYLGEKPDTLSPNTKIMSWLPQNDLLGHPKCKLFITHGGTNGIYEAIYHGVPMLGLPLLVDQFDNMVRIKGRGAGKTLDITNLNETEFYLTVKDMIHSQRYKTNAMRLSDLHKDNVMTPLDIATYWIEYVIRHKGAYHLRPAAHDLWWFQYHLIDVTAFIFAVVVVIICGIWWIHRLINHRKGKHEEHRQSKASTNVSKNDLAVNSPTGHTLIASHVDGNGLVHRGKNGLRFVNLTNGNGHIGNGFHKQVTCQHCHDIADT